ncbi:hypothetical protein A3841_01240 [Pontibacter flavimaris]|uniref:Uncharacterized protein n=2 Tax=Pontibacter flavimaris TaxID=1797110 RepID=A0A1Q5PBG4_9BACT|nr:hypothetical protein A3841_01240 [Pontibacter flavimaris]
MPDIVLIYVKRMIKTMKRIFLAGVVVVASLSLTACERSERTTSLEADEDNKVVVDRDSVATEYEVTETVVEYDTTTRTKTIDAEADDRDIDKDRDRDH